MEKIRLDKWLWAARFFKTRAKAKQAINGGKVHLQGVRCKASKEIEIGEELQIRQGWDEKTVLVTALSAQRRGAEQAALLYAETEQSIQQREQAAAKRKALSGLQHNQEGRPSKKNRRLLHQFREKNRL